MRSAIRRLPSTVLAMWRAARIGWSEHIWIGKRRWGVAAAALLVLVGGGLAFRGLSQSAQAAAEETPTLQTATVRTGSLSLTASGSGTLIVGASVELGFGTQGTIASLSVEPGDAVDAGDVLAEQADRETLEAAVTQAKLDLSAARLALQTLKDQAPLAQAQAKLAVAEAQEALADAQSAWQYQQAGYRASSTTLKAAQAKLAVAQDNVDRAKGVYDSAPSSDGERKAQAYLDYAAAVQQYQSALASLNWYTGHPTETQQLELEANVAIAEARLTLAELEAKRLVDGLNPDELTAAELRVSKAEVDLAQAETNLRSATVVAPFAGTVMEVRAEVGASVSGAFITLADLNLATLDTYFDETDLDKVIVGNEVEVVFDALPDDVFTGRLVRVDPSLTQSQNAGLLHAVAVLDGDNPQDLSRMPVGLNATVDLVAGRAENALLVPVEALREIDTDSFAVFVVSSDGSLELRPVKVGLRDLTWAEITSGLRAGEVVSTGLVETGE